MNYESKIKFNPPSAPDVTVTLKRMSAGRRAEFNRQMAEARKSNRELLRKLSDARDAKDDEAMAEASEDIQVLYQSQMLPALLRCFVAKIEGLYIDGEIVAADVNRLLADGSEETASEIADEIRKHIGLSVEERANLNSPTPSAQQADGSNPSTTAPTASGDDSTSGASADTSAG